MSRPKVGIFGLTGCAGDQLVVLNCEDELLALAELLDVRDFLMAGSANDESTRLDVALVEGAVLSARDEAVLRAVRARSDVLVAVGTCAVWGGIPAMDRDADRVSLQSEIYGEVAAGYDWLPARALHEVVPVDLAITGCPIEKREFIAAIAHLLRGDPPPPLDRPVCTECRVRENTCLLLEKGLPCMGPLTAGGCDARCIGYGVPCIGCRGPVANVNVGAGLDALLVSGIEHADLVRKLRTFAPQPVTA